MAQPPGRSLGYQHTSLFTRGELYWDLSIHHYSLPFCVDLGSPHPVGCCYTCCVPLGCTAPWEGMSSPPSASSLLEFRQAVIFCFLSPAKPVPPRWALWPRRLTAPVFLPLPGFPQKFPAPHALGFSPPTGGTGSFQHPIRLRCPHTARAGQ